jgi:hypothetical protein
MQIASVAIGALLSAIHMLALAIELGAVLARGRALARPLDELGWQRLLAADNAWASPPPCGSRPVPHACFLAERT